MNQFDSDDGGDKFSFPGLVILLGGLFMTHHVVELKSTDAKSVLKLIEEHHIEYVDLRFTDLRGTWHHLSMLADQVDEEMLTNGIMFDGSSIAGWKEIHESDMILMPDTSSAVIDPFTAHPYLILFCDVVDPGTGTHYERDPRSIAKKAEEYLQSTGIADTAYFGPEPEFFIFDQVTHKVGLNEVSFKFDFEESPENSNRVYEHGNSGHRPGVKGGYFPVAPVDHDGDLRADMCDLMRQMGLHVEKHHHEVASGQHELGFKYSTLTHCADQTQIYKYVVHNTAAMAGKTATFMPKPIRGDNGSGMHVHQSLWQKGQNVFLQEGAYANLSDTARYYIGGIIKHARAVNAFTNPTTNSYKRLVPGFEAPVMLAYSARNRSASCRIPVVTNIKATRMEVRFPDPCANPYLGFAAMMLAGLDGIKNKIDPGKPMDENLYDLPSARQKKIPMVCGSLREALECLDKDRDFLKQGDVFTDDMIDGYIALKMEEVIELEHTPHPVEVKMYYSS